MVCPHCGTENREEAKFCAQCGTPLVAESKEVERQETEVAPKETESVEAEAPTVEEAEPPEPLPEGALLFQRRYEIVSFVSTHDGLNEYEAMETEPRKRCPVCQTLNTADSNYCEQCGHDLADADLEALKVRLLEAKSSESLQPFWGTCEERLAPPSHLSTTRCFHRCAI
jgi:hypothetical protein